MALKKLFPALLTTVALNAMAAEDAAPADDNQPLAEKIETLQKAVAEQEAKLKAAQVQNDALQAEMNQLRKASQNTDTNWLQQLNLTGLPSRLVSEVKADPAPWAAGGALGIGLLGLWAWRRRAKPRRPKIPLFEDTLLAVGPSTTNILVGSAGGGVIDTNLSMRSVLQPDSTELADLESASVDPVAEAEVYLAYGRDLQAEEILRDTLQRTPGRHDVRLKLMEIYATRNDAPSLSAAMEAMKEQGVAEDDPFWVRAQALLGSVAVRDATKVEQDLALAAGVSLPVEPVVEQPVMQPTPEGAPKPGATSLAIDHPFDDLLSPVTNEKGDGNKHEGAPSQPAEPPVDQQPGSTPMAGQAPSESLVLAERIEPVLNLILPEVSNLPAARRKPESSGMIEIVIDEPGVVPEKAVPIPDRPTQKLDLDFEFDPHAEAAARRSDMDTPREPMIGLNLSEISLDLTRPVEPPISAPESVVPANEDRLTVPEVNDDPIAIKLDLARIYFEMGDSESANELLEEVILEGRAEQAEQARHLQKHGMVA
ncbi:FimV-like protein [Chitinivorax tropicus]|uniref:FimV-like protein n=1 Tax=Chitinivorax tropicus TaxID=714531 RepID=A0A840MNY7_9PROT|nr:FimV/HubP family polar landmark protein [Chitinivorax tropicus]MBB5018799.1 FimV-like protein [Chitinivorax tropicus]